MKSARVDVMVVKAKILECFEGAGIFCFCGLALTSLPTGFRRSFVGKARLMVCVARRVLFVFFTSSVIFVYESGRWFPEGFREWR